MLADLKFVLRSLRRNRTFTLVTVFTLALGIGSAAAIFSVADQVLFDSTNLPKDVYLIAGYRPGNRLMTQRFDFMTRGYEETKAMAEYAKVAEMHGNVVVQGQPVGIGWLGITTNLFPMFGLRPGLGRGFLAREGVEGADHVAIISERFWRQRLDGAEDVLGRHITLGDAVCTIVGVIRQNQEFPPFLNADVFRPLNYRVNPKQPWIPSMLTFGRLRPGLNREQARDILQTAKLDVPSWLRQFGEEHIILATPAQLNRGSFRAQIYWMLVGAVALLYAIAGLNASNLVLVRMLGLRRELSIRLALGGSRWRIIRLLVAESFALAFLGSLAGLLVAHWLFPLLLVAAGGSRTSVDLAAWSLGWHTITAMGLLTVATSVFIAAIPAFRVLRTDIYSGLKDGGAALGESTALKRLRGGFVVAQAAIAVVLLLGASLMIRTIHQLQRVDVGFDGTHRLKVQLAYPPDYPSEWEPRLAKLHEIQATLERIPGVNAVGFGNDVLLPGFYYETHRVAASGGPEFKANLSAFSLGFENSAGLTLKAGHWLTQARGNEVLVNESLARACWPNQNPVGQILRSAGEDNPNNWAAFTVAGVIGDVRSSVREPPHLAFYGPEGWMPWNYDTFVLRLTREVDPALEGTVRRVLYGFDPGLVVTRTMPVGLARENQLWLERMVNSILNVLAAIAALLTVVGLFSVLAYTVDRRMNEFGLRMALGATRGDLIGLVVWHGMLLAAIGLTIGLVAAFALTRYLQSLLYETSAQDPTLLAGVGVILLATAAFACVIPSYRATKVDITRLLRSE